MLIMSVFHDVPVVPCEKVVRSDGHSLQNTDDYALRWSTERICA